MPVFNTPGANANSVKEMVLCGLLLASRGIIEGINHVNTKIVPESTDGHKQIAARIEKDKKQFVGGEIAGKTLAVLGLGNIGALVAESAIALGMDVIGYDPKISVDAAWRLPNTVKKTNSLEEVCERHCRCHHLSQGKWQAHAPRSAGARLGGLRVDQHAVHQGRHAPRAQRGRAQSDEEGVGAAPRRI